MDAVRTALRLGLGQRVPRLPPHARTRCRRATRRSSTRTKKASRSSSWPPRWRSSATRRTACATMRCIRMELGEPDASGRRSPVEVPGSEFDLDVDIVVFAVGQGANPLIRQTTPDLPTNKWGNLGGRRPDRRDREERRVRRRRHRHRRRDGDFGDGRRTARGARDRRVSLESLCRTERNHDLTSVSRPRRAGHGDRVQAARLRHLQGRLAGAGVSLVRRRARAAHRSPRSCVPTASRSPSTTRSTSPTTSSCSTPCCSSTIDVTAGLKPGGTILVNTSKTPEELGLAGPVHRRDVRRDRHRAQARAGLAHDADRQHGDRRRARPRSPGIVSLDAIVSEMPALVPVKADANIAAAQRRIRPCSACRRACRVRPKEVADGPDLHHR